MDSWSGVLVAVAGSTWLIGNLSRADLWYVFVITLYVVVFGFAFIGGLKRRKQKHEIGKLKSE